MVVHFKIELEDLLAAQRDAVDTSKFHKRNNLIGSILLVIVFIIAYITIINTRINAADNLITIIVITTLGSVILFFLAYNILYKLAQTTQTKRLAKNNPYIIPGDCTLTISENGLFRKFKNYTQNIEWKEIKLVKEDAERYILYLSDIQTIVIKKSPDNLSIEEIQKFNKLIRHYLSQESLNEK